MSGAAKRKPTLLYIAHDLNGIGGMEKASHHHLKGLAGQYDITVISYTLSDELKQIVKKWIKVPGPRRPVALKMLLFAMFSSICQLLASSDKSISLGAITLVRPGYVMMHYYHREYVRATGSLAASHSLLRRLNTILVRVQSLILERWTFSGRARRTPNILAVSSSLGRVLMEDYPGCSVMVVPNGVDERYLRKGSALIHSKSIVGSEEILFVGGDWSRKGLPLLITACSILASRDCKFMLHIIGHGDEHWARSLPGFNIIGDKTRFSSPRPDLGDDYRRARVLCLPSKYETFSLVCYEAAACGTPVVATAVHGVEDLIILGGAGQLVDADPYAIANSLQRYIEDVNLAVKDGAAGAEYARAFSWSSSVKELSHALSAG